MITRIQFPITELKDLTDREISHLNDLEITTVQAFVKKTAVAGGYYIVLHRTYMSETKLVGLIKIAREMCPVNFDNQQLETISGLLFIRNGYGDYPQASLKAPHDLGTQ